MPVGRCGLSWLLPLLALLAGCSALSLRSPSDALAVPVVPVAAWGGTPAAQPQAPQPITRITHITLHHQGELWDPAADVPAYLRRLQTWSRETKHWADIPYHWVIAPDGRIYEARPWQLAGDTNTEYDPRGHLLVMLLGNFEVQHPTDAQWQAAVRLVAELQRRHGLDATRIATHRDHSGQTVCPGAHFYERFDAFKAEVAKETGRLSSRGRRVSGRLQPDEPPRVAHERVTPVA